MSMDIESQAPIKSKVIRLSVYLGYDSAGRAVKAQIKALAHGSRLSIGKLILEALKAKHGDFSQL